MRRLLALALLTIGCSTAPTPVAAPTPAPSVAPAVVPRFESATFCGAPVLSDEAIREEAAQGRKCDNPRATISGEYAEAVRDAESYLVAQRVNEAGRPLFWPATVTVMDPDAWTEAVAVRVARVTGWCAQAISEDEMEVKKGNGPTATSERFDVVTSGGEVWNPPLMTRRCKNGSGW